MRLIDGDELIELLLSTAITDKQREYSECVQYAVQKMPTVDTVPVRRGRWIKKRYWSEGVGMGESYGYWYACSECNHEVKSDYDGCGDRFCSNCGADMGKDGDYGKAD